MDVDDKSINKEVDEKSVTFKDEQKSPTKFPKANKIIQSIKLDR